MATEQANTAFAEPAQIPYEKDANGSGVDVAADAQGSLPSSKSYKLVKSPTGNMYVEVSLSLLQFKSTIKRRQLGATVPGAAGKLAGSNCLQAPWPGKTQVTNIYCFNECSQRSTILWSTIGR
jgi:hypothetical protein